MEGRGGAWQRLDCQLGTCEVVVGSIPGGGEDNVCAGWGMVKWGNQCSLGCLMKRVCCREGMTVAEQGFSASELWRFAS